MTTMSSQPGHSQHSPDVWFQDGNIIIRAESTLFRVYGGMLSAQSTVFADMFSAPAQPGGGQELLDGCPVVDVHDRAADMCCLLRAMHDPQYAARVSSCRHL
jgi:hypothetical protein